MADRMTEYERHVAGGLLMLSGIVSIVIAVGFFFGWGPMFVALGVCLLGLSVTMV